MTERLSTLVAELDEWIHAPGAASTLIERLVSSDRGQWLELAEHVSRAKRFEITRTLIEHAHTLLSRSPKYAVQVAHAAVLFAKIIIVPNEPESGDSNRALDMEAHAWREHAHALLTIGQFEEARSSANEAWFLASLDLASADDDSLLGLLLHGVGTGRASEEQLEFAATLALIMGQILHGVGQSDDGLVLISQAAHIFNVWLNKKKKYVEGRTIYATILADLRRYSDAIGALEQTAALAREIGDLETLAHIVNNIGVCYYFIGRLEKAEACVRAALEIFEKLDLHAEALRPRNTLATILIDAKRYSTAVSELYRSRAAFLEAGLANDAARVMLKIVRALILAGRARSINWTEAEQTFTAANVRPDVLKSLMGLRELAQIRPLHVSDVLDAETALVALLDTAPPEQDVG